MAHISPDMSNQFLRLCPIICSEQHTSIIAVVLAQQQQLLGMESCEQQLGQLQRWQHELQQQQPDGSPVRLSNSVTLYYHSTMITPTDIFRAYFSCRSTKRRTSSALAFKMIFERECFSLYDDLMNN